MPRSGREGGQGGGKPRHGSTRRRGRGTPSGPSRVVAGGEPSDERVPLHGLKRTSLAALWVAAALFVVALSVLVGVMLNHAFSISRRGAATDDSADIGFAAVDLGHALSEERWAQSQVALDARSQSAASERSSAPRRTDDAADHLFELLASTDIKPFRPPIASLESQLAQLASMRASCQALRPNSTLERVEGCRKPYTVAAVTASRVASAAVRAADATYAHLRTMLQWAHVLNSFFSIRCARAMFGTFGGCKQFYLLVREVSHAEAAHHGVTTICGHNQAEDGTWEGPELLAGAHVLAQEVIDELRAEVDPAALHCITNSNARFNQTEFSSTETWLPLLSRGIDSVHSNIATLRDLAKQEAADVSTDAGELTLQAVLPAVCASIVVAVLIYNAMRNERKRCAACLPFTAAAAVPVVDTHPCAPSSPRVVRAHMEQVMRRAGINYTLHNVRNPLHQILGVHQLLRDHARSVGDDMSCSLLDDLEHVVHDMTVAVDFTVVRQQRMSPRVHASHRPHHPLS